MVLAQLISTDYVKVIPMTYTDTLFTNVNNKFVKTFHPEFVLHHNDSVSENFLVMVSVLLANHRQTGIVA